jgi:hypothetical protein
MEPNKNLLMNKAMLWGFFVALALMIETSIFYATDNMFSSAASWISILIYIAGIVLVTLSYKKAIDEKTQFPYGRALGLGVATLFFASIIMALFVYILYAFIDPGLIDKGISFAEDNLLKKGISEEMVQQQIEMQRKFMTPIIMSISEIFSLTFYGLIISLITSIFFKKKEENGFNSAMNEIDDEE